MRAESHQIAAERIDLERNPACGLGRIEMEDRARALARPRAVEDIVDLLEEVARS